MATSAECQEPHGIPARHDVQSRQFNYSLSPGNEMRPMGARLSNPVELVSKRYRRAVLTIFYKLFRLIDAGIMHFGHMIRLFVG